MRLVVRPEMDELHIVAVADDSREPDSEVDQPRGRVGHFTIVLRQRLRSYAKISCILHCLQANFIHIVGTDVNLLNQSSAVESA